MKIKYLSLNVWRGGTLFDALLDFLKQENPEVMALQEVYNGVNGKLERQHRTAQILQQELNYPYFDFAPAFRDNRSVGRIDSGNAIFSKFPLLYSKVIFYFEPYRQVNEEEDFADKSNHQVFLTYPRNLQHAVINLGNNKLNVFNTHGVWGFDAEDNERRLEMSKTIVANIKNKDRVILSGDFNVKQNSKTVQNIEAHLHNPFKNKLATTFNTKIKNQAGFTPEVIDFIFLSNDIKIIESYCPQVEVSDHLPLVCVFEIV